MEISQQKSSRGWLPYALGGLLVALFIGLGVWQIGRAQQKIAARQAFDSETRYTRFVHGMDVRPYERLSAEGVFDTDHQFLLDNIIVDSRNGHYVLTPLVYSDEEPVLIVNRGWIERSGQGTERSALALPGGRVTQNALRARPE